MSVNKMVCKCNKIRAVNIHRAMKNGARTIDDIREMTGAATICHKCEDDIKAMLHMVCICYKITIDDVLLAIDNGANTVDEVMAITSAGKACGICRALIQNIIELGY